MRQCLSAVAALPRVGSAIAFGEQFTLSTQHHHFSHRGISKKKSKASTSKTTRATTAVADEQQQHLTAATHTGIFQSQHIKPFPVRAAIDIGTGGVMSLCVARVDARHEAIQKLYYQTQLPLYLERDGVSSSASASLLDGAAADGPFRLSERSIADIQSKMRVLHGAMRRGAYEGLSERAALISWPLCLAQNIDAVAASLQREFCIDVRVLGRTFDVRLPSSITAALSSSTASAAADAGALSWQVPRRLQKWKSGQSASTSPLKQLLKSHGALRKTTADDGGGDATAVTPLKGNPCRQLDALAFLSHAAMGECVAPQRLIVIHEDPQSGVVRLLGLATPPAVEVADLIAAEPDDESRQRLRQIAFGESQAAPMELLQPFEASALDALMSEDSKAATEGHRSSRRSTNGCVSGGAVVAASDGEAELSLVEHKLPIRVADAHQLCITAVQKRPEESYHLHQSSPNPLLATEYVALRSMLQSELQKSLPAWASRKSALGGMIAGTSWNGGLLNLAARASQQTRISLQHLDTHAEHHFCGLTDVLLAASFPAPLLVLPSLALASAVMRTLQTPRVEYLPEVTAAAALLVQPSLWAFSRADAIRSRLSGEAFYSTAEHGKRGRVFHRPHRKDQPSSAPDATWIRSGSWNDRSIKRSFQGT